MLVIRNATAVDAPLITGMIREFAEFEHELEQADITPEDFRNPQSLISPGLVGSRLSQPYSTHLSKLILISQQEYLVAFEHRGQKMIPRRKL